MTRALCLLCVLMTLTIPTLTQADPCGMVPPPPPPYLKKTTMIERIGAQKTYVFYKNGIESFVIRPGFKGRIAKFGMLIPFPTPPAMRKVPNEIFSHIASAIDPPEVVVHVRRRRWRRGRIPTAAPTKSSARSAPRRIRPDLAINAVRVIKQEAVGMYQVAVLEAGSAKALARWMKKNGFVYPKGMDKVVLEYIRARWCFVAVKARVAGKKGVSPRPGMRQAKSLFPKGGTFTGKVQAMGFRFRSRRLVVPMRLSAFNKGKLRNIVYLLTDRPKRINHIPQKYVVRQLRGKELYRNVAEPLPLRIIGGGVSMVPKWRWPSLHNLRNPKPHNGHAKDLFASDLRAASMRRLTLKVEEKKKVFLRIEERLRLRGKEIDAINQAHLAIEQEAITKRSLSMLRNMTMTVVDGDFPRPIIARENLTFRTYYMPKKCNKSGYYHARTLRQVKCGQAIARNSGNIYRKRGPGYNKWARAQRRNKWKRHVGKRGSRYFYKLIRRLSRPKLVNKTLKTLVKNGNRARRYLIGEVRESPYIERRGWSIVALTDIKGDNVNKTFQLVTRDPKEPKLLRYWTAAAQVKLTNNTKQLSRLAGLLTSYPGLKRPFRLRTLELLQTNKREALHVIFDLATRNSQLRQAFQPIMTKATGRELIPIMLQGKNNSIRATAASYMAMQMNKQPRQTWTDWLRAIRFSRNARRVPWKGGALYTPTIPWNRVPTFNQWTWRNRLSNLARSTPWQSMESKLQSELQKMRTAENTILARQEAKRKLNKWFKTHAATYQQELLLWLIWATKRNQLAEARKIRNNLSNRRIGMYTGVYLNGNQFGQDRLSTALLLQQWSKRAGKTALYRLVKRAGTSNDREFGVKGIQQADKRLLKKVKRYYGRDFIGCYQSSAVVYSRYVRRPGYRYRRRYVRMGISAGYVSHPRECVKRCRIRKFPYGGVGYGQYCYCSKKIRTIYKYPLLQCMFPCYRNKKQYCGGRSGIAVFNTGISGGALIAK